MNTQYARIDNFGYVRQLSTPDEQQRPGGAGVYYHLSYWGKPSSYLWLGTTPPALVTSEMGRAWETNARRLWIFKALPWTALDANQQLVLAEGSATKPTVVNVERELSWAGDSQE